MARITAMATWRENTAFVTTASANKDMETRNKIDIAFCSFEIIKIK